MGRKPNRLPGGGDAFGVKNVLNESSASKGDSAYHDGSGGDTEGPAYYDGSDWKSLVDNSTIAPQTAKDAILAGDGISGDHLPQTANIIRYWAFDDGSGGIITDHSTSGVDANADGTLNWVSGYGSQGGISVASSSERATPASAISAGLSAFTVAAVVKWDSFATPGGGEYVYDCNNNSIFITSESDRPALRFIANSDVTVSFGSAASTGTYYLVTGRYDGSTTDIWNGGTQGDSLANSGTGDNQAYTDDKIMGFGNGTQTLPGDVSMITWWDTALTDSEIQNLATTLEL